MMPGRLRAAKPRRQIRCEDLLEPLCREVIRQRDRVLRRGGVESVHDLRVASRRLQEILEFLAPYLPDVPRRKLHRRARRVRRTLGQIRNADVMVALASELMQGIPAKQRHVFRPVLSRLQDQASQLRGTTIRSDGNLVPGIRKRVERLLRDLPRLEVDPFPSRTETILSERLRALATSLSAARRESPATMHRLRISVKRYRYSLEIAEKMGQPEVLQDIEEARHLQGVLGRLHDLDVLLGLLRKAGPSPAVKTLVLRLRNDRRKQIERTRAALKDSKFLLARLAALHPGKAS